MHSFDFVCIGAGGGPSETDLSAYFLKPSETRWEDGIIAVEAGSGIGALTTILSRTRDAFHEISTAADVQESPEILASRIYSYIQTFLISHSHLDHVLSLVLSSGSLPRPPPLHASPTYRRRITGTKQVLDDLATMIFSDRIWPNLASWSSETSIPEFMYLYDPVPIQDKRITANITSDPSSSAIYHPIASKVSVLAMPISHGLCRSSHAHAPSGTYASTAFFIKHDLTKKQFLFFGDVEPDSLALNPSTGEVWRFAASLIAFPHSTGGRTLDSIFIECSWPSTRTDAELFGHLNPQHLLHEMKVLASEVVRYTGAQAPLSPSLITEKPAVNATANNATSPTEPVKKKRRRTLFGRRRHTATESNATETSAPASSIDLVTPLEPSRLVDALKGVKLYVMHFKAPMQAAPGIQNGKLSQHIAGELRALVEKEEIGLEVIAMEQGMRIQI